MKKLMIVQMISIVAFALGAIGAYVYISQQAKLNVQMEQKIAQLNLELESLANDKQGVERRLALIESEITPEYRDLVVVTQ